MKSKNPRHNSVRIVRRDYRFSGTCLENVVHWKTLLLSINAKHKNIILQKHAFCKKKEKDKNKNKTKKQRDRLKNYLLFIVKFCCGDDWSAASRHQWFHHLQVKSKFFWFFTSTFTTILTSIKKEGVACLTWLSVRILWTWHVLKLHEKLIISSSELNGKWEILIFTVVLDKIHSCASQDWHPLRHIDFTATLDLDRHRNMSNVLSSQLWLTGS